MSPNPYDETPYESFACPDSHPNRLAVIATLFGLEVPALAHARVLEIGCASGGNLLPLAAAFPGGSFVGLDYSARQMAQARLAQAELGLSNIEFRCVDIAEVAAASLGKFDFILVHGVYSWLPPAVQTALLGLCRDCLNPRGIAYVSYNTLPGWHSHAVVRELMQFHLETVTDRQHDVPQARGVLDFMAHHVQPEQQAFQLSLSQAARSLAGKSDSYLRHDYLAETNEPLYFKDFVARAAQQDLAYLGDADFPSMVGDGVTPAAYQQLTAQIKDIVRLEQYLDFLRNRSFRMTLLVKKGVAVKRSLPGSRVKSFWMASDLQRCRPLLGEGAEMASLQQPAEFKTRRGLLLKVASPLTAAALHLLQEQFPQALEFADLLQQARSRLGLWAQQTEIDSENTLANDLLALYTKPAAIEFFTAPPPVGRLDKLDKMAGAFPLASAYARWQAGSTARLTNLRHETVTVGELERKLLPWLDGQHSAADLQTALRAWVQDMGPVQQPGGCALRPQSSDAEFANTLTRLLESLAAHSFLCGPAG